MNNKVNADIVPVFESVLAKVEEIRDLLEYAVHRLSNSDVVELTLEDADLVEDNDDSQTVFTGDGILTVADEECIGRAAEELASMSGVDELELPVGNAYSDKVVLAMAALAEEFPRWKHKHIHIGPAAFGNAELLDIVSLYGDIAPTATVFTALARDVYDVSNPDAVIPHTELEEKLIQTGQLASDDYLVTHNELLHAIGADYTIRLLPGMSAILNLIETDEEGNASVKSAIRTLQHAARKIWSKSSMNMCFSALVLALNLAASAKEADLTELIAESFKEEINAGKRFYTIPQLEEVFSKTVTEVANMITQSGAAIRMVESSRGGSLFVVDRDSLNEKE